VWYPSFVGVSISFSLQNSRSCTALISAKNGLMSLP
jgi:hypothetical protein